MLSKRFLGSALFSAVVIPAVLQGCSSDGSNPLCCTEFKVGATLDANIGGSAQSQVAAQAVADFAGIASASIDDLTTACRGIATDLDAPKADQDAAEANTDKNAKMKAWCSAAVKAIGSIKATAGGSLKLEALPPKCEASVSAKANCQAKCDVSGKCDIKANPPKCTGGKLEISCKGSCTAEANASVSCTGSCSGECSGSCTAEGGVDCAGKCDGTCEAKGGAGGSGVDAQGNCQGTCKGTCEVTAPGVTCTGSCKGECKGECKASAGASVQCDGKCDGDFEPLKCEGGKLEGGCQVDAKCDANCDASVSAKAQCTPPSVTLTISGAADVTAFGKLKATLEANLPLVFSIQARIKGMADIAASFSGNINASVLGDLKAACIPPMVAAVGQAVTDVNDSVSATASITGSVGG
jgi:hypothetical protein